ncbi:MAG: site-specific integrase [Bacteroidetes bacterium]|nr:site-specific integrase [Bacteroidota bacterium]
MSALKVVLRQKQNKDGTYPLALRITKDRRTSFIHLGHNLHESDWNKVLQRVEKSHPNWKRLNNLIIQRVAEASDKAIEMETAKKEVSSSAVKQKIKPQAGSTFFKQADLYLDRLKAAGKYNRYTADKPRVKHFKDFMKNQDVAFSDITLGTLERFRIYLKAELSISERTIINHLVVVRSVFSQAIKEGVADAKYYPFGKGKIVIKFPESTKVGISKEEVEKLEKVALDHPDYDHARNLWLISYYFAGMRISDVLRLRWSDFQEMRLHYTMGKNKKAGSLKTPEKALKILEKYESAKNSPDDLVFPDLKVLPNFDNDFLVQRRIAFSASRYDKFLREQVAKEAKITSKLTMHIARHTFASLAGDKIPIQMLQKLYRHSNISTTIGYQASFIHKDADDALEAVIGG